MLDPEKIKQMDTITGLQSAPAPTAKSNADLIRSWAQPKPAEPTPVTPVTDFGGSVAASFKEAQSNMGDVGERQLAGKQNPGETFLQALGVGAKLGNDVIGHGLKAIWDMSIPEPVKNMVGSLASHAIDSNPLIKAGLDAAKQGQEKYDEWAKTNPKDAASVSALVNIPLFVAQFAGAKKLPEGAVAAVTKGEETVNAVKNVVTGGVEGAANRSAKSTWEMIKPNLTPTEQAAAVTEGKITQKGILGTVRQIPKGRDLEMITAADPYVAAAKNPIEAVANMQKGIADEATALKTGLDQTGAIYSKSQISGALTKIEAPTLIASDATLSNAYRLVKEKMVSLVGKGGKLGDLLEARKSFDAFVQKQFPNLYSSETLTPMRSAIRDIRNTLNDVIDARLPDGKLPNGISFRESLKKQSLLYDAIDNTAPKVGREGSNIITRAEAQIKKHPIVTGVGSAATILGAGKALGF